MISTLNSSTNRISGLASGLDTETLVEQLTSVTQGRIDAAEQEKQVLEWKQEYYQEILTSLTEFNTTYFGTSTSALTVGSSLGELTATSSNSQYVTAIGSSSSTSQSVVFSDIVSLATAAKTIGTQKVSGTLSTEIDPLMASMLSGKSMNVTLDGVVKTLTFSEKEYTSAEDVATELESLITKAFGSDKITVSTEGDTLSLTADTSKITLAVTGSEDGDASTYLGFDTGCSNRISLNSKLSELNLGVPLEGDTFQFTINGESFSFNTSSTLNNVITGINNSNAGVKLSYSSITDKFTLTAKETGTASTIDFSDESGNLLNAILGTGKTTAGTDCVVKVGLDGATDEEDLVTLVRSSNTFEMDGTTYTVNGLAEGAATENVTVTTAYDVDSMVDTITSFVTAYNALIDSINDKLNETYYDDFPPLTEDQKESLTESEQAIWTEKAKSGLLRNDSALKSIVSELRSSLYDSVAKLDGSGNSLGLIITDVGITTNSYSDYGKLTIDEAALRTALTKNTEGVLALFTQKASVSYSQYNTTEKKETRYEEAGLLWRLSDIIKNNISKVGKKGALVEMVGSPDNSFVGTTSYSKKISTIETTISTLTDKLADEQDRYWAKFTAMETAINNLNSQSSWLTQQLSS